MYRLTIIMVSVALLLSFACSAQVQYQGALTTINGVGDIGTKGTYGTGLCSIGWRVTAQEGPWGTGKGPYLYEYWISSPANTFDPSHWLLQVTKQGELQGEPPFAATYPDFYNFSGQYTPPPGELLASPPVGSVGQTFFEDPNYVELEVQLYSPSGQGGSNPGLVGEIFGLKFEDLAGGATIGDNQIMYFAFDSWRHPVWGDFYVKGGSSSAMWNKDFGFVQDTYGNNIRFLPATDGNLYSGGTMYAKVLAPDGVVPEPATMALIALGLGAVAGTRRRKWKKD